MDYKKLADLLFPHVNKTIDFYEKKYPKRNLPEGSQVTRFAPSPTGYLHIGHLMQSICDVIIAKKSGGIFYLRLEDTDQKRLISDAFGVALNSLKSFGVVPDEGPTLEGLDVGNYGPYVQGKRLEIYATYAKKLVSEGKAYPCFCNKNLSKEDVLARRQGQLEELDDLIDGDVCASLSFAAIEKYLKQNKPFAIRLKSKAEDKIIKLKDIAKGEREFPANKKDVVLLKSDGYPVYGFAHAIDDHLMKTTVVVRGGDWIQSLATHLEIFDALGFDYIPYIHTPNICKLDEKGNKRKISKSKDPEADVRFFIQAGYPIDAFYEYLINILNTNFEMWRIQNPNALIDQFPFDMNNIGSNDPILDFIKLNDMSKNVISNYTAEKVYHEVFEWAKNYDTEWADLLNKYRDYSITMFNIDRNLPRPRKDIAKWGDTKGVYGFFFDEIFNMQNILLFETNEKFVKQDLIKICDQFLNTYNEKDDKQTWFEKVKVVASANGYATNMKDYKANAFKYKGNVADVCCFIRVLLTGKQDGLDLHAICNLLGYNKIKKRFKQYLESI